MNRLLIRLSALILAVCAVSVPAVAQAVTLTLSSQSTTYCATSTDVGVGDVAVTVGNNGTIPSGATIQVFLNAPLTSAPTLSVVPAVAGVTLDFSGGLINIRFATTVAVTIGTRFQVGNIRVDATKLPSSASGVTKAELAGVPQASFTFGNGEANLGRNDSTLCPVTIVLSAPSASFRALVGSSLSIPATFTVTSTTGNNFALPTLTVTTDDGGSWIAAGNNSVTVDGQDNTYTISILPQPGTLAVGKYTGKVSLNVVNSTNNPPASIAVTLVVFSDQPIVVSQNSMFFRSAIGVDPPSQTFTATVTPPVPNPAVTVVTQTPAGGNWLSVITVTTDSTLTLTVSPKAAGLAATSSAVPYAGLITFSSELASQPTQTVIIQFQVDAQAAVLNLTQNKMDFTAASGTSPATSLTATVGNTGGGTLTFTAAATTDRGGNWLNASPASGTAPSTLTVTANPAGLAPGFYTGTVTVTGGTGVTNSPQRIAVTLTVGTVPKVADRGIKQGASFSDGTATAGTILSMFGTNLATGTQSASSLPLPTLMAGGQVKVNGNAAPLFYVSPTQINFQLPTEVTGTSVTVTPSLNSLDGTPVTVPLVASVPGLFSLSSDGTGPGAILKSDFTVVSSSNPASRGSVILIYGTGFGATTPNVPSGQPAPGDPPGTAKLVATPTVSIGGQSAQVIFAGLAPGFVGLFQLNVVVPTGTALGNVPVVVSIGGASSNTVTVAVQ